MNIDPIQDKVVQTVLKALMLRIGLLEKRMGHDRRAIVGSAGGVRSGPESDRGDAADRYPEVYLETSSTKVKVYVTIPTGDGGPYNWLLLNEYTF